MTIVDAIVRIRRYIAHSRQYLENALVALQHDEAGKAGELLWGSVAEAIQAVATYQNVVIATHRDLKNFVIQLGRDKNDSAIQTDFAVAESLHQNFYVVQQETIDVVVLVPTIQAFVLKLLTLIPPEAYPEIPEP